MIKLWLKDYEQVKLMYQLGASAQEIKDALHLDVTVRQIQRRLAADKLTRTVRQSYHLAIAKGRMDWKNRRKLRLSSKLNQD